MSTQHGGKRTRAGRPPIMQNGKRRNIYVSDEDWRWLKQSGNASGAIAKLIEQARKSPQ